MNLDVSSWKEFKLDELFKIKYGVNLELSNCVISTAENAVNFVARTSGNNGVVAQVERIEGVEPQKAGSITCASGGSVLSTFVQTKDFYSGRDLYLLIPKEAISLEAKLFCCTVITKNKYRYNYGRQANKTLRELCVKLPEKAGKPDWSYMEKYIQSLKYKPLTTKNRKYGLCRLDTGKWREYQLSELFDISVSVNPNLQSSNAGRTPYVAASSDNNGVTAYVDLPPSQKKNVLTIARNGSVGSTFYQPLDFCSSPDDIRILTPKFKMNVYIGLFIKTIIEKEKFRYTYGRKLGTKRIQELVIKLPSDGQGKPDFKYMECYIKSLPYGDRI